MKAVAVRAERFRLEVRQHRETMRVSLDAGWNDVSGAGAFDHELQHDCPFPFLDAPS